MRDNGGGVVIRTMPQTRDGAARKSERPQREQKLEIYGRADLFLLLQGDCGAEIETIVMERSQYEHKRRSRDTIRDSG